MLARKNWSFFSSRLFSFFLFFNISSFLIHFFYLTSVQSNFLSSFFSPLCSYNECMCIFCVLFSEPLYLLTRFLVTNWKIPGSSFIAIHPGLIFLLLPGWWLIRITCAITVRGSARSRWWGVLNFFICKELN